MSTLLLDSVLRARTAEIGSAAPDFSLIDHSGHEWRLSAQRGKVVVLLFYPRNETVVCTQQLCSVRDNWENYLETKAVVAGVSPGTPEEHAAFAEKRELPMTLLADPGRAVTRTFAKHWAYPVSFTRAVVIIDANGVVRTRDIMLRVLRPSDPRIITDIYSARGDSLHETYDALKDRFKYIGQNVSGQGPQTT